MEEVWKDYNINGKTYKVSNYGNVKKCDNIVKQRVDKDGYLIVSVCGKHKFVHRLVAELFVDGYQEGFEVNHIDCDRQNNKADNLEWLSHKDNIYHSIHLGHYDKLYEMSKGETNPKAKLTVKDVKEIKKKLKNGATVMSIAKEYGRGWTTIDHIKKGETWKDVEID